jgi:predicted Zn-dependent peptidase
LLLSAFSLELLCGIGHSSVLDPRTVASSTFDNGLRLIVCEDSEASVVSVELFVRAGSADDPPGQEGIAHLLEHVLWTGGSARDARLRVEQIGGAVNAGTLRDFTRFYATVPSGGLDIALQALAAIVLQDHLEQHNVVRERQVVLEESAIRGENARAVLNDLAFQQLYGRAHPYGHAIEGTEATLATIGPAQLSVFHDTWYVPNNMGVIVAGNAPFEHARTAVASLFGDLLPGTITRLNRPDPGLLPPKREHTANMPVGQAHIAAVFLGPSASEHGPVCVSDVIATLLASPPCGRLARALQEDCDLASAAGVEFLTQRDPALFAVWAVCDTEHVPAVKEIISRKLVSLSTEPVPGQELAAAKRLLAAAYAFANETPQDRAATLAFYDAVDTFRSATHYLARVQALTSREITHTAARLFAEPLWIVIEPRAEAQ